MMSAKKTCDQCAPLAINGVFCHESGCPNCGSDGMRLTASGCDVREGEVCCGGDL